MLTTETKKKIDYLRDVLVGKIPVPSQQIEQITLGLIYKFMSDIDEQNEELGGKSFFSGEYKKYAWKNIMDRSLAGHERVLFYAEGLEKMSRNDKLPQLFRDIFKGAFLPFKDPAVLDLFLKGVNEFKYENSEELGNAFEYLLSTAASQGDAGQFRTPRHIIDFIVEVVDPQKEDKILDPACGTAGFLVSAYKHILKNNTDKKSDRAGSLLTSSERKKLTKNIVGYDISHEMVRLSLVNLYLHGFAEPSVYEYDTLSSLERWDDSFDCLLANPPFMTPRGGIKPHNRFPIQAKRSEVLFVDYITEHLTSNGKAGIIVPEGIIFQSGNVYKQLRKMLVEDGLWAVASLPQGVFSPYSLVKTSILFFNNTIARQTKEILFVKIENDGFDLGSQRRPIDKNDLPTRLALLNKYKKTVQENKNFSLNKDEKVFASVVKKEKIAENGEYNLSAGSYFAVADHANTKWPVVELGEVCKITTGRKDVNEGNPNGVYPFFTCAREHTFIDSYSFDTEALLIAGNGDVGVVKYYKGKFDAYQRTYVLSDFKEINAKYLYQILNNSLKENLHLQKLGNTMPYVKLGMLQTFKIPLPPIEIQELIVMELDDYQKITDGAKQIIDSYKPTIKIDPKWGEVELGDICDVEYGYGETAKDTGDIRYIRITDINEDGKLNGNPKYVSLTKEAERYLLNKGDLVVARTGATYGKTLLFDGKEKAIFASFLMRLNFDREKVFSPFYWLFTQTQSYWTQARALVTGGAQPQFNGNVIKKIKIPLPSISEQKEIYTKIEKEQELISHNKEVIKLFEQKIKDKISEVWGEK